MASTNKEDVEKKVAEATEADAKAKAEAEKSVDADAAAEAEARRSAELEKELADLRASHEAEINQLRAEADARLTEQAPPRVRNSVRRPGTKVRSFDKNGKRSDA